MKCPNCKLEVSEGTKICPNCNYDFENKSYKNIGFKKLNLRNKILYVILIIFLLVAANSRFIINLSRSMKRQEQREELLSEIYGQEDDNYYTFDEMKVKYPSEIEKFEDLYNDFMSEIQPYSPQGQEENRYVLNNGKLLFAFLDATITYEGTEIEVSYSKATPNSKNYSYQDQYNLECEVDQKKLAAFSKWTGISENILERTLKDFMKNIKSTSTLPEEINLDKGRLLIRYGENGKIAIDYEMDLE